MPTGNFGEPLTPTPIQEPPQRAFRFPADYYSAPLSEVRPIFPKWVPLGCGVTSAILLVVLFVGGALFSGPRLAQFMDFIVGTSLGELRGMLAKDIPAPTKQHFETEVEHMREGLRNGKVPVQNLQPFIRSMQAAISDKRVTTDELEHLTKAAHDATLPGRKKVGTFR